MILLVGGAHKTIVDSRELAGARAHAIGRLLQPRDCDRAGDTAAAGIPWAADNDGFQGWTPEREARFVKMLDRIAGVEPGPKFVTVPDVVGDARATATMFSTWLPSLVSRGLPVALVAQDGVDEIGVPWGKIDALFIGGSTDFKLGPVAAELVLNAKRRGKWAHIGRVNTRKRIRYAAQLGADSVDGTSFSRWRKTNLPGGTAAATQSTLQTWAASA